MVKSWSIPALLALIVALPFLLRRPHEAGDWRTGDPLIVIVTPHTESIRYEFERAFSDWHKKNYGQPVKIEWRAVGGTSEIIRYLASEYASATKSWWTGQGKSWPAGATDAVTNSRFPTDGPPPGVPEELWRKQLKVYQALRATDDPKAINIRMDLFFGGGEFDHTEAFRRGLTVPPWREGQEPAEILQFIPARLSGETWRSETMLGTALSTFGISYNIDRLRDLGIAAPPAEWEDLTNPVYFRQLALADPTKSGSAAKAFENIVHQRIYEAVRAAGFSDEDIGRFEKAIGEYERKVGRDKYRRGDIPDDVPAAYQQAIEKGWEDGIFLIQSIGANARYFTDSASKVPIDVSVGDAAVGMLIDFYGRAQSEMVRGVNGEAHMNYVTPVGGSSVSCDPISLLRGAGDPTEAGSAQENTRRQVAVRFIEFVLSEEGQRLWCYKVGAPGGPAQYALRRLPIRRDFYPSTQPAIQARHLEHLKYSSDDLADPTVNPYHLAEQFVYQRRWTGSHFGVHRDLVRAMCIDSGLELREAWDPTRSHNREAMKDAMRRLPTVTLRNPATGAEERVEITWRNAPDIPRRYDRMEYMRKWTEAFRAQYRDATRAGRALQAARQVGRGSTADTAVAHGELAADPIMTR